MEHIFNPVVINTNIPQLEYRDDIIELKFRNTSLELKKDDIDFIENLWGDIIPKPRLFESNGMATHGLGNETVYENNLPNNFLDMCFTANIHPIVYGLLQEKFKQQEICSFAWERFSTSENAHFERYSLRYTSKQARLVKVELVHGNDDRVKCKVRIIMPCFMLGGHLTKEEISYYTAELKSITENKFDYVVKMYLIYILKHRNNKITDQELSSVEDFIRVLELFKEVKHKHVEDGILITLSTGDDNYHFKYLDRNI